MKNIGYHRTSTKDQHLDRGILEIKQFCSSNNISLFKDKIYTDQLTGKNFNRPGYLLVKELLEEGDSLIITEVDRLGRDKQEIMNELRYFKENNIRIMILELPTTLMNYDSMNNEMSKMILDTINNMLIDMFASLAHAEMIKREKRQKEGIQAKKLRGEWDDYGRPRKLDFDIFQKEYKQVVNGTMKPFVLMRKLNLSRSTFYRYKRIYDLNSQSITSDQ